MCELCAQRINKVTNVKKTQTTASKMLQKRCHGQNVESQTGKGKGNLLIQSCWLPG